MLPTKETVEFIRTHRTEDVRTLALQAAKHKKVDMPFALRQIEGWQTACRKLPLWSRTEGILYPPHLSMEQCSSEQTAEYKANVMGSGNSFADLTGGFGVDFSFMARRFTKATYVEQNAGLCHLAQQNFRALGLSSIQIINEKAERFLDQMPPVDGLFMDPARRDEHGGKTVAIPDCTPDVKALLPQLLQKAVRIMIKLSPMLDISLALRDLPPVTDVHIIAVQNECKELLLVIDRTKPAENPVIYHTINMRPTQCQTFTFTREEEQQATCHFTSTPQHYLYEPDAALLKAGAFRLLSQQFHLEKLHPNSHLYTSDTLQRDFPGRIFQIEQTVSFNKKDLKMLTASLKRANLATRNFPSSVAELRKRLKLKEGGDIYLFATTLNDERKVLLQCRQLFR